MMCVDGGDTTEKGTERTEQEQSQGKQNRKCWGAHSAFGHHSPAQLTQLLCTKSEFLLPGVPMPNPPS